MPKACRRSVAIRPRVVRRPVRRIRRPHEERPPLPGSALRRSRLPGVVVFARQPVIGTVKTRLAADIGPVEALRFYRTTLTRLLRRVRDSRTWRTMLAVTPDRAGPAMSRIFGIPAVPQGPGDLGTRMRRVARNRTGPILMVGSDIPDLRPRHLRTALAALRSSDFVFGPAEDGGYWLAGFANRRPPRTLMRNVRWSTSDALADTLASAGPCARVRVLEETLADIDDGSGFGRGRGPGTHPRHGGRAGG